MQRNNTTPTVDIFYNPYKVRTEITINGKPIEFASKLLSICRDRRIQEYVDDLLPKIYDVVNSRSVDFVFHGRGLDFNDLESALALYKVKADIQFSCALRKSSAPDDGNRINKLRALYEKSKSEFKTGLFDGRVSGLFEEALDPTFEVSVIATMSAGKSTIINAMLGRDFLASSNKATTAVITKVEDDPSSTGFVAYRHYLKGVELSKEVNGELLKTWNDAAADDDETNATDWIELKGHFSSVSKNENSRLVIVDTPGPNSLNPKHRQNTYNAISSTGPTMVLFVINATNPNDESQNCLLERIQGVMKRGGRKVHDRFIFLLNKIDCIKKNEVEDTFRQTCDYLEQFVEDPIIIPVSALTGLLSRRIQNHEQLDEEDTDQLCSSAKKLKRIQDLIPGILQKSVNSEFADRIKNKFMTASEDKKVEWLSGIPVIEELLNDFITKYAVPVRLKRAIGTFASLEHEMKWIDVINHELTQSKEESKSAHSILATLMDDMNKMEEGVRLQEEIKSLTYKRSNESYEKIFKASRLINEKYDQTIHTLEQSGQMSREEANKTINSLMKNLSYSVTSFIQVLQDEYQSECERIQNDLTSRYRNYVKEVLGRDVPSNTELVSLLLNQITTVDLSKYWKRDKRQIGTEWAPTFWNWFRRKPIFEDTFLFNSFDVRSALGPILNQADLNWRKWFETLEMHFNNMRDQLLDVMKDVQEKVKDIGAKLKKVEEDVQYGDDIVAGNQKRLEWYKEFTKELDAILAV